jgi:hypothetical protein
MFMPLGQYSLTENYGGEFVIQYVNDTEFLGRDALIFMQVGICCTGNSQRGRGGGYVPAVICMLFYF